MVPTGLEPATVGLLDQRSTNWAKGPHHTSFHEKLLHLDLTNKWYTFFFVSSEIWYWKENVPIVAFVFVSELAPQFPTNRYHQKKNVSIFFEIQVHLSFWYIFQVLNDMFFTKTYKNENGKKNAVSRIRTGVSTATTWSTNHYTNTAFVFSTEILIHNYFTFCWISQRSLSKKNSEGRFRSSDLWVMSPTRYRCATSLQI